MGICYICSNTKRLLSVLGGVAVIWLIAIMVTPLGFPYGGDHDQPTPMRLLALVSTTSVLIDLSALIKTPASFLKIILY